MNKVISTILTGVLLTLMTTGPAIAGHKMYEVTITNLTQAETFTPIMVASSRKSVKLFKLGEAASPELTAIAEGGDVSAMTAMLLANPQVVDVADSSGLVPDGLLVPGASVTVTVSAKGAKYISLASMLIPTNDAFLALNGVRVNGWNDDIQVPAYDAGTETNDEDCANIPGPDCGGDGIPFSPGDSGEGYVYIHGGIHGIGDLDPATYDWRNPVAHVKVVRVK